MQASRAAKHMGNKSEHSVRCHDKMDTISQTVFLKAFFLD